MKNEGQKIYDSMRSDNAIKGLVYQAEARELLAFLREYNSIIGGFYNLVVAPAASPKPAAASSPKPAAASSPKPAAASSPKPAASPSADKLDRLPLKDLEGLNAEVSAIAVEIKENEASSQENEARRNADPSRHLSKEDEEERFARFSSRAKKAERNPDIKKGLSALLAQKVADEKLADLQAHRANERSIQEAAENEENLFQDSQSVLEVNERLALAKAALIVHLENTKSVINVLAEFEEETQGRQEAKQLLGNMEIDGLRLKQRVDKLVISA